MFHKSAPYYDLLYRELKDYREEAAQIDALLQRLDPAPRRLLDVGCGTGAHALQLITLRDYQIDGIDIEPRFVEIAAAKLPHARFEVADMRDFSLNRRYDALLCLFSSIGYVETLDGLRSACAAMARHLEPGGWLLCEPWITPEQWQPGQIDATTATDPRSGATLTRTRLGKSDGGVSVLEIDYEFEDGDETRRFSETHRLGLFTRDQTTEALAQAGFACHWTSPSDPRSQALVIAQRTP